MPVSSRLARKMPSISPTVGKFCTPANPTAFTSSRKPVEDAEWIGAVHAGQNRRPASTTGRISSRHLHDDLVGVAESKQPRQRAASRHAVATGIVYHDQVDAAGLLAFRRQAGSRAAADDRHAPTLHVLEFLQERASIEACHFKSSCSPRGMSERKTSITRLEKTLSLMLPFTRSTRRDGEVLTVRSIALNSASSASGSQNALARRVERGHAANRQQEANRTVHRVQSFADPFAELRGFRRAWCASA